jgi:hypothetical protein
LSVAYCKSAISSVSWWNTTTFQYNNYEKIVWTVMVNKSTNINKTNNLHTLQTDEHLTCWILFPFCSCSKPGTRCWTLYMSWCFVFIGLECVEVVRFGMCCLTEYYPPITTHARIKWIWIRNLWIKNIYTYHIDKWKLIKIYSTY